MPDLELALVQLGRELRYPETPDLAPAVRARLAAGRPSQRRVPRRALVLAFAALAVIVAAAMAVPQSRAAILEFFGLRGVTIERVERLPEVNPQAPLVLGEEVTLEEAQASARFPILVPEELGEPDAVYFSSIPVGGMVSLVYGDREDPRALFTQFRGSVQEVAIMKKAVADTDVRDVFVGTSPGFWLSGAPHVFRFIDANGEFSEENVRLAGNVLLWERGGLTLRLEADVSQAEAIEIGRSVRPLSR
jgi:hypothetical protein